MSGKNPNLPVNGGYNTYIGARYIPLYDGIWDKSKAYEPLTLVYWEGRSYVSKTFVPSNTELTDTDYWGLASDFNVQVEQYRDEVNVAVKKFEDMYNEFSDGITGQQTTFEEKLNKDQADFEKEITDKENQHVQDVLGKQNNFESTITEQENQHINDMNDKWEEYKQGVDQKVQEQTTTTVTDWLETNLSGGDIAVDESFTVPGAASDSKMVGDTFLPVVNTSAMSDVDLNEITQPGFYNFANNKVVSNLPDDISDSPTVWLIVTNPYSARINSTGHLTQILIVHSAVVYLRYKIGENWGGWATNVDVSLTRSGGYADAKTVGDSFIKYIPFTQLGTTNIDDMTQPCFSMLPGNSLTGTLPSESPVAYLRLLFVLNDGGTHNGNGSYTIQFTIDDQLNICSRLKLNNGEWRVWENFRENLFGISDDRYFRIAPQAGELNIDELKTPGVYNFGSTTKFTGTLPEGYNPERDGCSIIVLHQPANFVIQWFLAFDSNTLGYRIFINDQWRDWVSPYPDTTFNKSKIATDSKAVGDTFLPVVNTSAMSDVDLNEITQPGFYNFANNKVVSNLPDNISDSPTVWLIVTNPYSARINSTGHLTQILIVHSAVVYLRYKIGENWGGWATNVDVSLTRSGGYADARSVGNTRVQIVKENSQNADTLFVPGIYPDFEVSLSGVNNYAAGVLLVVGNNFNLEEQNKVEQIFISYEGNVFARLYDKELTSWTTWSSNGQGGVKNADSIRGLASLCSVVDGNWSNVPVENGVGKLDTLVDGNNYYQWYHCEDDRSFYRKVGETWKKRFIWNNQREYHAFGDSTTYGQIAPSGRSPHPWPDYVGAGLHLKTVNHGVGGQGLVKNWDTIQEYLIEYPNADLISIGWAYNDDYSKINLGSYNDELNGDSLVSKYYTVMHEMQVKNTQAIVVLVTGFGTKNETGLFDREIAFLDGVKSRRIMWDELEKMCDLRGYPCINQDKESWIGFDTWDELIGDNIHPTNEGYAKYGRFLCGKFSQIYRNVYLD